MSKAEAAKYPLLIPTSSLRGPPDLSAVTDLDPNAVVSIRGA